MCIHISELCRLGLLCVIYVILFVYYLFFKQHLKICIKWKIYLQYGQETRWDAGLQSRGKCVEAD